MYNKFYTIDLDSGHAKNECRSTGMKIDSYVRLQIHWIFYGNSKQQTFTILFYTLMQIIKEV